MSRHETIRGVEQRDLLIAAAIVESCLPGGEAGQGRDARAPGTCACRQTRFRPCASARGSAPAPSAARRHTGRSLDNEPGRECDAGFRPDHAARRGRSRGSRPARPNVQVVRFQGRPASTSRSWLTQPSPGLRSATAAASPRSASSAGSAIASGFPNITERPGAELFPVIEVVGHLHRPREIDPGKYPIRVVFTDEELWDVRRPRPAGHQGDLPGRPRAGDPHQAAQGPDPDRRPSTRPKSRSRWPRRWGG